MNNDEDGGLGNLPHNQDGDGDDDDDDDDDDVTDKLLSII